MTDANESAASPSAAAPGVALALCLGPHLHIQLHFVRPQPQSELSPPQNSRGGGWLSLAVAGLRSSAPYADLGVSPGGGAKERRAPRG
jgi:hypothetical protein